MRYDLSGNLLVGQVPDPVVIIAPTDPPVSLTDMKSHLRVEIDDDDSIITALTTAATQYVEKIAGLAPVDQTLELRLDTYPPQRFIQLRGPLLHLLSYKYTDADGDLQDQDADSYIVESSLKNIAPRIVPAYNATWPYAMPVSDSLRVQWRAGFVDRTGSPTEDMTKIPGPLLSAVKLHVEAHYERDERTFKMLMDAVDALLSPYRVSFGVA